MQNKHIIIPGICSLLTTVAIWTCLGRSTEVEVSPELTERVAVHAPGAWTPLSGASPLGEIAEQVPSPGDAATGRPFVDLLYNAATQLKRRSEQHQAAAEDHPLYQPEVFLAPAEELRPLGYVVEQSTTGRYYDTRCVTAPDGEQRCRVLMYPYAVIEDLGL